MENTTEAMNITLKGLQLYNKVQTGKTKLNISRVAIGDGYLSAGETAMEISALKHEVDTTATIISNNIIGDGTTCITIRLNEAAEAFYLREIGIMANDPDEGEILYAYCNYGDYADYIKYYGGVSAEVQEISIYTQIGNASSVNIDIKNAAAVTQYEFEQHINDENNPHNVTPAQVGLGNVINAKQATKEEFDAHTNNKTNPHNVTAAQIGLGNLTNEKQATKTELDTHMNNRANPHNVTAAQVGLGNVINAKQATKEEFDIHANNKANPHNVTAAQIGLDHVRNVEQASEEDFQKHINENGLHCKMIFGVYTGNGETERFINLGFTPTALEIYRYDGSQVTVPGGGSTYHYGGLAIAGNACGTYFEIVSNGFKIYYNNNKFIYTNTSDTKYYFIAYSGGQIMEIE